MVKKTSTLINIIAITLIILSVISCNKDSNTSDDSDTGIKIGKNAPNFTLPDKNDNMISLTDFDDKLILVNFWASWCHFCRDENPHLVSLYSEYKEKGLEIIGVSIDTDKFDWLSAVTEDRIEYVQVSDFLGTDSPVYGSYGVQSVPKMFLLNDKGVIIMITSDAAVIADEVAKRLK